MKFTIEIQNSETLDKRQKFVEKPTAQEAHKEVYLNLLEKNEEIVFIQDEDGHPVFIPSKGFFNY